MRKNQIFRSGPKLGTIDRTVQLFLIPDLTDIVLQYAAAQGEHIFVAGLSTVGIYSAETLQRAYQFPVAEIPYCMDWRSIAVDHIHQRIFIAADELVLHTNNPECYSSIFIFCYSFMGKSIGQWSDSRLHYMFRKPSGPTRMEFSRGKLHVLMPFGITVLEDSPQTDAKKEWHPTTTKVGKYGVNYWSTDFCVTDNLIFVSNEFEIYMFSAASPFPFIQRLTNSLGMKFYVCPDDSSLHVWNTEHVKAYKFRDFFVADLQLYNISFSSVVETVKVWPSSPDHNFLYVMSEDGILSKYLSPRLLPPEGEHPRLLHMCQHELVGTAFTI